MGIRFDGLKSDISYYKDIFIDAGCPVMVADSLARGHIGMEVLSSAERKLVDLMLQGYPYATAKEMAKG